MITGKTSSGFAFKIKEEQLDNMELVDAIAEAEENPVAASRVLKLLLGDQRKELYDTLRTTDGRVPVEATADAIKEIFAAGGKQAKNS